MTDLLDRIEQQLGEPVEFIARLKVNLRARGITQAQLADAAGLPEQNISRWMRGHVQPSLRSMLRLQDAFLDLVEDELDEAKE